mgnify:CR=1 FL=1
MFWLKVAKIEKLQLSPPLMIIKFAMKIKIILQS